MTSFDPRVILALCPNADAVYVQAFDKANSALLPFRILDNERRLSHFLAQILHESGGLTRLVENLNYSAKRLYEVWPSRFPSVDAAAPFAQNPQMIANAVYGGRMGNIHPDDGWTFRGRGLIQITGRSNYALVGRVLGCDFVSDPDVTLLPEYILPVAAAMWKLCNCNELADVQDIRKITRAINGGYNGLAERQLWLGKVQKALNILSPRKV